MANDNPEDVAKRYYRRACCMRETARGNSLGIIALFISALLVVGAADLIVRWMDILAGKSASSSTEEQLEEQIEEEKRIMEVQLGRRSNFNGIAIIRGGQTAAVAGDDGLVMISDGDRSSWTKAPSNTERGVYGIALSDNGRTAVAVGRRGLIRFSSDGGETWADPGNITAKDVNGVALSGGGNIAVAVGDEGLARISTDGGETWEHTDSNSAEDINGIALSHSGEVAICVGDDGLILVSNNVSTEHAKWSIRNDTREERGDFRAVAVSIDGKVAIAVGRRGLVYRSEDSGKSWEFVQSNVGVHLNAVTLSGDGIVAVAVGDDGTVLVSTDGGKNWDGRNSRTSNALNAVALEEGDTAALIVGDDIIILQLTLSGQEDLSKITSVGELQIRHPLSEEEVRKIEREVERFEKKRRFGGERKNEHNDRVRDFSTDALILRIASALIFLLWIRHTASVMYYHWRLAAYYKARGDAILLLGALKKPDEKEELSQSKKIHLLKRLMRGVSPDDIDIGRPPRGVMEHAMRLARAMLRRGKKD